MAKMHIKSGDEVIVISGKDKGKKGKVLSVFPEKGKAIVEGVAVATKHQKPRRAGEPGGIIKQESPVDASNLMNICSKCGKPARIGRKVLENGDKIRYCKKCNEVFND